MRTVNKSRLKIKWSPDINLNEATCYYFLYLLLLCHFLQYANNTRQLPGNINGATKRIKAVISQDFKLLINFVPKNVWWMHMGYSENDCEKTVKIVISFCHSNSVTASWTKDFFFSKLVFPISISPLKELLVFLQVTREYWSSNIQRNEGKNQANKKTGLKCFEECWWIFSREKNFLEHFFHESAKLRALHALVPTRLTHH